MIIGIVLVIIGAIMLLVNLDLLAFKGWEFIWSAFIILIGGYMIYQSYQRQGAKENDPVQEEKLEEEKASEPELPSQPTDI